MTHVTSRLTAKNRDQLRNPTFGNRVWATFFTLHCFTQEKVATGQLTNATGAVCRTASYDSDDMERLDGPPATTSQCSFAMPAADDDVDRASRNTSVRYHTHTAFRERKQRSKIWGRVDFFHISVALWFLIAKCSFAIVKVVTIRYEMLF